MKTPLILLAFIALLASCAPSPQAETTTEEPATVVETRDSAYLSGELLFKQHCTSCHLIDRKLVGPALKGTSQKYKGDEKWLYDFIRNSPKMIKSGDPKAVAVYEANAKMPMNAFPFLTDTEIANMLHYIETK